MISKTVGQFYVKVCLCYDSWTSSNLYTPHVLLELFYSVHMNNLKTINSIVCLTILCNVFKNHHCYIKV